MDIDTASGVSSEEYRRARVHLGDIRAVDVGFFSDVTDATYAQNAQVRVGLEDMGTDVVINAGEF